MSFYAAAASKVDAGAVVFQAELPQTRNFVELHVEGYENYGVGFELRQSDDNNLTEDFLGVTATSLPIAGENQGTAAASATQSGTIAHVRVLGHTLILTIAGSIVMTDNGAGEFTKTSGVNTIVSSAINYVTGAWSVVLGTVCAGTEAMAASYSYAIGVETTAVLGGRSATIAGRYKRHIQVVARGISGGTHSRLKLTLDEPTVRYPVR